MSRFIDADRLPLDLAGDLDAQAAQDRRGEIDPGDHAGQADRGGIQVTGLPGQPEHAGKKEHLRGAHPREAATA